MAKHRKRRPRTKRVRTIGRHRVVTPKSNFMRRGLIVVPMALAMALYPVVARDGEGNFPFLEEVLPGIGASGIGIFKANIANAGEVIAAPPIDLPPVDLPPVDALLSPK